MGNVGRCKASPKRGVLPKRRSGFREEEPDGGGLEIIEKVWKEWRMLT